MWVLNREGRERRVSVFGMPENCEEEKGMVVPSGSKAKH